jgi:DNA-directed RNA polymerase specialized sigma24 family protein
MRCGRPGCGNEASEGQKFCSARCAPFARLSGREVPQVRKWGVAALSIDEISQFKRRARHIARTRGYAEYADDFAQDIFQSLSRGRHATIEQLFVDFLRKERGDLRTDSGRARAAGTSKALSLDAPVNRDQPELLNHEVLAGERTAEHGELGGQSAHLFSGDELELYDLHFVEQCAQNEIAEYFGMSEAWVSIKIRKMRARIVEHHTSKRLRDRFEEDSNFGVLEVEWITM